MFERIFLGVGRRMIPVPEALFRAIVRHDARKLERVSALEPDERRVHHFAVRELPRRRAPIAPALLAEGLDLPAEQVQRILDELEGRMTFLCRRGGEEVVWAYPVTAESTPHQVRIDGGAAFSAA